LTFLVANVLEGSYYDFDNMGYLEVNYKL